MPKILSSSTLFEFCLFLNFGSSPLSHATSKTDLRKLAQNKSLHSWSFLRIVCSLSHPDTPIKLSQKPAALLANLSNV